MLNHENKLVLASDLFLGKEYQFGQITEKLFEGVFKESQYLKGNQFWNLDIENQNVGYLDSFFIWLGVNTITKFSTLKRNLQRWENDGYTNFVFDRVGYPQYDSYKNYDVIEINYYELFISNCTQLEKLIVWIILDHKLITKLDYENKYETFSYTYGSNTTTVENKPSYFLYQISKSKIFENVFVDFEYAEF
ncbi:MAG: hypothetical protein IPH46_05740 [Bacteroidetes bacterium]|nr:hypothetical protein [Bacteroidota bacterium]